jgi:hypothetical protein
MRRIAIVALKQTLSLSYFRTQFRQIFSPDFREKSYENDEMF